MKKSSVYTKGGDKGQTSLVSGSRISKGEELINLYGDLDGLNSHIGFLISLVKDDSELSNKIKTYFPALQSALFDLGSKLACESEFWEKYKLPNISPALLVDTENLIDELDGSLPKLKAFILPGGNQAASYGHVVRTECRKVERELVRFQSVGNIIPELSLELLNRLSDFFFVYARYLNALDGGTEVKWIPSPN
jgi:cob(I)alamin adenosyltransferase